MTAEAVYWSRAVPRAGCSSSRCSCCPSPPRPLPGFLIALLRRCACGPAAGAGDVLSSCVVPRRCGARWQSREPVGKASAGRAGGRAVGPGGSIQLRSGGSDAAVLRATGIPRPAGLWPRRETPGGDGCPGAASRGPCCGWEMDVGTVGGCTASPAPVLDGANAWDRCCGSGSADTCTPGAGGDRVTAWGCRERPLALPASSREIPGGRFSVRAGARIKTC